MNDGQPAFSCCGDSQERREPSAESAAAAAREDVESRGTGRARGLSQKPSGHQGLERSLDLWEVVSDIFGQTLALEEGPWVSMEEQQEIEVTRVLQAFETVEEVPDSFGRHPLWRLPEAANIPRPLSGGQEGTQAPAGRPTFEHCALAFRELLDFLLRHRLQP